MKIPDVVPVGGMRYVIQRVEAKPSLLRDNLIGEHSPVDCVIRIADWLPEQKQWLLFWNNIVGAINSVYLGAELDSNMAHPIAGGVYQVMRQLDKPVSVLQFGGMEYRVEQTHDIELQADSIVGQANHDKCIISVASWLCPQQKAHTVYHESTHCIDHVYLDDKLTEQQVSGFSHGWYQVAQQLGVTVTFEE